MILGFDFFLDEPSEFDFDDVEPLFLPEDVCVFDRYTDGDPYEDRDINQIT